MPTYVLLTRIPPEALENPQDLRRLEKTVSKRIRSECPKVIRSFGHAVTETWSALLWERFERILPT